MGIVWKAVDTTLDREVAIKVLPENFAADPARLTRFEREAKTLAALSDPGIAAIYSVHLAGEVPFLTLELVRGEPLTRRIGPAGMPITELLDVAMPLSDAVAVAHAEGIVHRDLKPDNVMLTAKGRLKVLDFGLTKLVEGAPSSRGPTLATVTATQQGSILGTVNYMSPEQAEGLPVDARSDVFSLGTMLYEMATGRRPFDGKTSISTLTAILRDTPPPVTALRDELPKGLAALIARCLERDRTRRFHDAAELRDALRAVAAEIEGMSKTARRAPSSRMRPALTAAAVVAVLAVAAWLALGRRAAPLVTEATGRPVAVMGFENLSDPDDAEKLGRVLMGLVTTDLVESRGLDVVSTARVLAAIREVGGSVDRGFDLSVADRAAAKAGAALMLVGQVNRDGERIRLAAELVDVHSGRTTGSIRREARSISELFALAGSIAAEVRRQLGAPVAGSGATRFDLAESLTSS